MRLPPFSFLLLGVGLLLCSLSVLAQSPQSAEQTDVRLIVDISGSMKQNDPANLRKPAVRLVTELLPEGSKAGVWTFGQYVNMLVPYGKVDDQWRAKARERSSEINSVALHTNIGEALEVASDDFYRDGDYANTHFILLTDGMVDIPGGEQADLKERKRILGEVLERFKVRHAKIHPVALSDNADKALLERLAVETGGSFQIAKTDADLSRAFLAAFNSAAPVEEVPLEDEGFTIDGSIDEFTALIFRGKGNLPVKLSAPDGKVLDASTHPDNVRWLAAEDYTLVTVTQPAEGRWTLAEAPGPGSRIKVVSDLRMGVTDLPNYFYATDTLNLDVAFYEKDKRLTDPDFLGVIDVRVSLQTGDGRTGTKMLSDPNQVPADGTYHDTISKLKRPGEYTFTITADGKTFKRQQRQTLILKAPFDVETQGEGSGNQARYKVSVLPRNPAIVPEAVEARATITLPDGTSEQKGLEQQGDHWALTVTPSQGDGDYTVQIDVQAQTESGEPLTYSPGTFTAPFPRGGEGAEFGTLAPPIDTSQAEPLPQEEPPQREPVANEPAPEDSAAPQPEPEHKTQPEEPRKESAHQEEPSAEEQGMPWWIWALAGGGLLVIAGGAAFFVIRRRKAASIEQLSDSDSPTADQALEDEAEKLAAAASAQEEPEETNEVPEVETPAAEEPKPETEPEEAPNKETEQAAEELEQVMTDLEEDNREPEEPAPAEEPVEETPDEEVPTLEEATPEPEESSEAPEEPPSEEIPEAENVEEPAPEASEEEAQEKVVDDMDAEALADQILAENEDDEGEDEDEFSLEDFDISDVDDLPSEEDEENKGDEDGKKPGKE
ncbi:VWA domain-containing protein [Marinobacteraceae bacterium S3BR75-40.1]